MKKRRGKILKVKLGYNPNSSSIGTDVVIFFTSFTAITAVFNLLGAFLKKEFGKNESTESSEQE